MKSWTLRFNTANKTSVASFEALRDGTKTIETRAATAKYRAIMPGDTLIFVCGKKRLEKSVTKVKTFASLDALLKALPYRKVNPWAKSVAEVKRGYDSYAGYKDKLKKFGILAFSVQ